jgi:hypothetical protein
VSHGELQSGIWEIVNQDIDAMLARAETGRPRTTRVGSPTSTEPPTRSDADKKKAGHGRRRSLPGRPIHQLQNSDNSSNHGGQPNDQPAFAPPHPPPFLGDLRLVRTAVTVIAALPFVVV